MQRSNIGTIKPGHKRCSRVRQARFPTRAVRTAIRAVAAIAISTLLVACAPKITRHGHLLSETEIQQVQPGMSQEEVQLALGTPDTKSTVGGNIFYYISSTKESVSFLKPKTVDRRVVAVYFDPLGSVERVGHYGLKDGKVIDFVTRETVSQTKDRGFLQQVFRGIGKKKVSETQ